MVNSELAQALRATHSAAAFADVVALLDAMNAAEFDLAMATAAERLGAWPDDTRAAPGEDWRRAQTGALPRWWPLVRHVRVMNDDRLDAAAAQAPLTSVDASGACAAARVDPASA